jgi:Protein of unknown function (DUF3455)
MYPRLSRFVVACVGLLAVCGLIAAGAAARPLPQTSPGDALDPRTYAPASKLFLSVYATGVQKYTCQANGTWLFTDPEATLYLSRRLPFPIGTHYLNFATGRPVWKLKDGSTVEAARTASVPAPAGNIAWLLLQATATSAGDYGGILTRTTWVQRLNTVGGIAPAGACTPGQRAAVPYATDYHFWQARRTPD